MVDPIEFETERLRLRQWLPSDRVPFAELNSDPGVMAHFPSPLTRAESDRLAEKYEAFIHERGWGFWAAELKEAEQFIGFVSLHIPSDQLLATGSTDGFH